jgi:hypothetical protein
MRDERGGSCLSPFKRSPTVLSTSGKILYWFLVEKTTFINVLIKNTKH